MWISLVLLYGVIKGVRDVIKKQALTKNSTMEVLFFYTFFAFLLVTPGTKTALEIDYHYLGYIFIKSFVIFIAWICSFSAIERLPIGFFGIMDMSRVIFASVLGILILGEGFTPARTVGMLLVLAGLFMVNFKKDSGGKKNYLSILCVLLSCLLNAVSEIFDKYLMHYMNSTQLQFWYMLFLVLMYFAYILITRTKINIKSMFKNYWIIVLSVLFVIGDKALFIACAQQDSSVIAMTLIKQCSVMITIIGGRIVFKEKGTLYKILCAMIIIAGIVVAVL